MNIRKSEHGIQNIKAPADASHCIISHRGTPIMQRKWQAAMSSRLNTSNEEDPANSTGSRASSFGRSPARLQNQGVYE